MLHSNGRPVVHAHRLSALPPQTLAPTPSGPFQGERRAVVLFGCGGERDTHSPPTMLRGPGCERATRSPAHDIHPQCFHLRAPPVQKPLAVDRTTDASTRHRTDGGPARRFARVQNRGAAGLKVGTHRDPTRVLWFRCHLLCVTLVGRRTGGSTVAVGESRSGALIHSQRVVLNRC